jgi:inner membrane protein involved in colicin E2 resistance
MRLPAMIQPGELSTALIFSAPISLMFFFVMLFVVATLQKLEIHPVNYLFLAAAFFAFHLLFSYSADHLTVPWAFGVSSVVSLLLVVSYLRLVVSPKFALREAALGQLVYLVGFSLAHFWEGYTGLTVTVLAILTLFLLMQATGRLRWAEVLASGDAKSASPFPDEKTASRPAPA